MIFLDKVVATIRQWLLPSENRGEAPCNHQLEYNMARPIPQIAIDLIKKFEHFEPKAYRDPVGVLTIGYGWTHNVEQYIPHGITEQQAEELLRQQLQDMAPRIIKAVNRTLNNNQLSALLSFCYNVGLEAFLGSHLLQLINGNDQNQIVSEFLKWDHAGGKVLPGLLSRRRDESSLFFQV